MCTMLGDDQTTVGKEDDPVRATKTDFGMHGCRAREIIAEDGHTIVAFVTHEQPFGGRVKG